LLPLFINKKEKRKDDDDLGKSFGCGSKVFLQGSQQVNDPVEKHVDKSGNVEDHLILLL
jgi:hypothetical protein